MKRNRRLLLGTVCVEAVAAVSILTYGYLSLVAVAVLYWFDLLFLTVSTMIRQLASRPTTPRASTLRLPPFRLLRHKVGSLTVTDWLPPLYLRNVPAAIGGLFLLVVSVGTTTYVSVADVPTAFWTNPATPLLIAGGVAATAAKSWLRLTEYIDAGTHESEPASATTPSKRLLLFVVYAAVLVVTSEWAVGVLADDGIETARNGMMFFAAVLLFLRLGYGIRASRTRFGNAGSESSRDEAAATDSDGLRSRLRSMVSRDQDAVVPTPPSVPNRQPIETTTPNRLSVLTAGIVNAVTTGGVVDRQFSTWRAFAMRGFAFLLLPVAVLALLDGAVVVSVVLAGVFLCLTAAFSAMSAVHMLVALGGIEYRFYESEVVAYDRYLETPQWSASYDNLLTVSVETGLFGGPLWLGTGTVFLERTDGPDEDDIGHPRARSSLAFVPNPERVGEVLRSRMRRPPSDK